MQNGKHIKVGVSGPENVIALAQQAAADEYRSFSAYVMSVVIRDLRARGYLDSADERTQLSMALDEAVRANGAREVLAALNAMLRKEAVGE